ncbi:unnamed protein product [Soboliphyme baturini]|uniref:Tnp_DDE_dom domain-containing protein n=1 Tax=Soboliphyme baturini TaxID=241478 RepID=A0A183J7P7_9BILA|nr:unnamed protein product [Soboliphyme baturini]
MGAGRSCEETSAVRPDFTSCLDACSPSMSFEQLPFSLVPASVKSLRRGGLKPKFDRIRAYLSDFTHRIQAGVSSILRLAVVALW